MLSHRDNHLRPVSLIILSTLLSLLMVACDVFDAAFNSEERDVIAAIDENLAAANAEDIPRYMATIHPESPLYATTEDLLRQINQTYDLSYEVSDLEVLSLSSGEARVAFTLTTRLIDGLAFRDNRVTGVFILRRDNGQWKIYGQEIENIEYLD